MNWFVVRTKPKHEFKAQDYFKSLMVQTYIATTPMLKSNKYKIPKVVLPSYIFTRLEKLDYNLINCNPFTRDVLKISGKPALISDKEIQVMQKHLTSSYDGNDFYNVTVGDLYSIPHGMFSGQTGEVVQKTKNKISLLLKSLGVVITISLKQQ